MTLTSGVSIVIYQVTKCTTWASSVVDCEGVFHFVSQKHPTLDKSIQEDLFSLKQNSMID